MHRFVPRNLKYNVYVQTLSGAARRSWWLAASHVPFPCSLPVASFQLTTTLSLPHMDGSTLSPGKHRLTQAGYTPASSSLCFLPFSSSTHPHAVHHQDIHSFNCPLAHYHHAISNTTHKPPHAARNGIQTPPHRPRRPPYGHRSAGYPNVPRQFSPISFTCKYL